jgi:preprotein translocase subunit SecA
VVRLTPEQEAELLRQRELVRQSVVAQLVGAGPAPTAPMARRPEPAASPVPAPAAAAGAVAADLRLPQAVRAPSPGAGPARRAKVGRNDPCPCGSGKKYKHCCGR